MTRGGHRRLLEATGLWLACGAITYLTLRLTQGGDIAAFCPAVAFAVGALALRGRTEAWGEIAGLGLVNGLAHFAADGDPLASVVFGLANAISILVTCVALRALGVRRGGPIDVRRLLLLFLVAALAPAPGAFVGAGAVVLMKPVAFASAAGALWLVQSVSFVLWLPPFLFWKSAAERQRPRSFKREAAVGRRRRLAELIGASAALAVAGLVVPISGEIVLIELSAMILLWFALRFGVFVTSMAAAMFAACVIVAAFAGFWPHVANGGAPELLLPLQSTLALTTMPALIVAVVMAERRREIVALDRDARRLAYALDGANDGLWDWHIPTATGFFSARACRMFGYEPNEFVAQSLWDALVHPEDVGTARTAFDAHASGGVASYEAEMRCRHRDGHWVWVLDRGKIVERDRDGRPVRAVGTLTDISERKNLEQALEHLATHDPLTGLANRDVFERGLERAAARLDRLGGRVAVVLIDLDHFKQVNDTFGHAAGDLLLAETAVRLRTSARTDDLVARLGGDEFAIVASGQTAAEFDVLAERLCAVLSEPVFSDGFEVKPSVSIGVAVAGLGSQVNDDLVVRADRALYAAKSAGRGTWRFFGGAGKVA